MTYFACPDEFGHICPCVGRNDPRHKESPVFGLAGFVLPSNGVRSFGAWFVRRKCDLLLPAFEIMRSGKHAALWEKEGASLYPVTDVSRYPGLRGFANRLYDKFGTLGGFVFYAGIRNTALPRAHSPNRLCARVFPEAIKRTGGVCGEDFNPAENFVLLLGEHEQRSSLLAEAPRGMYARHGRRRHLIEPPFHLESHRYQTLQAADWTAGLVGRLGAVLTKPAAWPENVVIRRYFGRRPSLVSLRSGIRSWSRSRATRKQV